jgi:hypothetical protein
LGGFPASIGCTRENHVRFSDTSSRLDEDGTVTITAPVYATMPVGHTLAVCGSLAASRAQRGFDDWLWLAAFLATGPQNGAHAVKADAGAVSEAIANGSVHPSLVLERVPGDRAAA